MLIPNKNNGKTFCQEYVTVPQKPLLYQNLTSSQAAHFILICSV